ncbi:11985_t:CDS:1, partial [Acaulospora morrowiae]
SSEKEKLSLLTAQVAVVIWLEQSSPPKVSPPKWQSRSTLSFFTSDTCRSSGSRKSSLSIYLRY